MTAPLSWRWVQAIRGWYVPQPIGWAWREINRLPVIRKDLSRAVEGQPRRIHRQDLPRRASAYVTATSTVE